MKNKPIDLHNHLFEQLERLNDDDLKGEDFERESRRAKDMCSVAAQIISNRNSLTSAIKALNDSPESYEKLLLLE